MTGHDWVEIAQAAACAIGFPLGIWAARPIILKALDVLSKS